MRGTIFDSIAENIQLIKQLNKETVNICILSAVLKLLREIRDLVEDVLIDGLALHISEKQNLFEKFSRTISCTTKFSKNDFDQLAPQLISACEGPAKSAGIVFFENLVELVDLLIDPKSISPAVVNLVERLCVDVSSFNHLQLSAGLVLQFNMQVALAISIETGGNTTGWSLHHLDSIFKPFNKSPTESFVKSCQVNNHQFRFL